MGFGGNGAIVVLRSGALRLARMFRKGTGLVAWRLPFKPEPVTHAGPLVGLVRV